MFVDVAEQAGGVNAIEIYFGKIANHHFPERDKLLERIEAPFHAFQRAVNVKEFEQEEFVWHDLLLSQPGHEVVDAYDFGKEKGFVAQFPQLFYEKKSGAPVVENDDHTLDVVLVFGPDTLCYRLQERFHLVSFVI